MSAVDKKRWDDFAKNGPQQQFKRKPVEKFTSQGIPISQIDKEQALAERTEKNMKNQIQDIIDNASNTKGKGRLKGKVRSLRFSFFIG